MGEPRTNLTVEIDAEALTLGRFQQLAQALSGLVSEVGNEVGQRHRNPVRWVIVDVHHSNVTLELSPERTREDVPADLPDRVADAIASGMAVIEERAERPPYFSDRALERAKQLSDPVGAELRAVRFRRERAGKLVERVTVTRQLAANVDELIGPKVESFGTIEGKLEGIVVHDRRTFFVWETLTNRRVECSFGDRIALEKVLEAFGRRVATRGIVRKRKTGEPVSIEANELYVFPAEDELPGLDEVQGILGDGK